MKARRDMSVAETREAMRAGRVFQLEPPVPVPVRDAVAHGVPVRLYGGESAAAMVYMHGGRFFSGDLESHDWPLRMLAAESGCRICAVDYRLAPEYAHPAALEDSLRAAEWLAAQSDRIYCGGDSAGGYLAAAIAMQSRAVWQVLIYPMLDPACDTESYRQFWQGPWPSGEDMKRGWDLYGGPAVGPDHGPFPPTLLITAGIDPLRDEALSFAEGLRARGVSVEQHDFPDCEHGFFTKTKLPRSRELLTLLAAAIRRYE